MSEKQNEVVTEIPLSEISSFPDHPYQVRDDDSMNELVESVKERGLIQPVSVRPVTAGRALAFNIVLPVWYALIKIFGI